VQQLTYQQSINTSPDNVWKVLTNADYYQQWAKAFSANSQFIGDWVQGKSILFVDPDMGGTKAILDVVEPDVRILARHVATVDQEGIESTTGEMTEKWIGSTEDYQLESNDNGKNTRLTITINTHQDFVAMFEKCWPDALATLTRLSESLNN
jgi:uncharacterized protein YndB with AHSA1/START domain